MVKTHIFLNKPKMSLKKLILIFGKFKGQTELIFVGIVFRNMKALLLTWFTSILNWDIFKCFSDTQNIILNIITLSSIFPDCLRICLILPETLIDNVL